MTIGVKMFSKILDNLVKFSYNIACLRKKKKETNDFLWPKVEARAVSLLFRQRCKSRFTCWFRLAPTFFASLILTEDVVALQIKYLALSAKVPLAR
jgi:hypothetical protein